MNKVLIFIIILLILVISTNPKILVAANIEDEGLTIRECIKMALTENWNIKVLKYELAKTRAEKKEIRADLLPQINLEVDFRRSKGLGQNSTEDNNSPFNTGGSSSEETTNEYKVSSNLSQVIFDKRLFALISKSKANLSYIENKLAWTRQDIIYMVKDRYFNLLKAKEALKLKEENLKKMEIHRDMVKAKYTEGVTSKSDILMIEANVSNAELEVIKARHNIEIARSSLNITLNRDIEATIEIADILTIPNFSFSLSECIDYFYKNHHEMRQMEDELRINEASLKEATAKRLPSLNANAFYGWKEDKFFPEEEIWMVSLNLKIPIFTGFKTDAEITKAKETLNGVKVKNRGLIQEKILVIKEAYQSVLETGKRLATMEKYVEQTTENLKLVEARYREGLAILKDIIDAQTLFTEAKTNHIQAIFDYNIALAKLNKEIGKEEEREK